MPASTDDQVINKRDAEQTPRRRQPIGESPVGPARFGISAWMVVDNGDRNRPGAKGGGKDLARMNQARVDTTSADFLRSPEATPPVEKNRVQ